MELSIRMGLRVDFARISADLTTRRECVSFLEPTSTERDRSVVPSKRRRRQTTTSIVVFAIVAFVTCPLRAVLASDDYYKVDDLYNYAYNGDGGNSSSNNSHAYNGTSGGNSSSNKYRNDDYYKRNKKYYVDDQYYSNKNKNNDGGKTDDNSYQKEQQQYQSHNDDTFHWDNKVGFEGVSVMPVSCIN
jgi:hypothetical protein